MSRRGASTGCAATPAGARLANVGLPAARIAPLRLGHHLAVADFADLLLAHYATAGASARWITERELRRDGMAEVRDRRDGRLVDGVAHVPDGVLEIPARSPTNSPTRTAVELELTTKGLPAYRRILRWYGGTLAFARVAWFCATPALQQRVEDLVRHERMDDLGSRHHFRQDPR